ncbi:MAG: alpha/beta hydrolase [Myxococcota bacterium]|nr:alpha/beta hydrolase [Myxococcota bacterium]
MLHGILGSGRNWRGFCRRLLSSCPTWQFVLPDLRCHGGSREAPGARTVEACVEDIAALCADAGWRPRAVVGHSFGGKVALGFAARVDSGVASVWALDTPPSRRGVGARGPDSEVGRVLTTLRSISMPAVSREAVTRALEEAGFSPSMTGWMATNLRATDAGVAWRFDLDGAEALIEDYFQLDLWPTLRAWPGEGAVNLLAAGHGGRWTAMDRTQARAARVEGKLRFHTLPTSGHWVHVDAPDELAGLLASDLSAIEGKMARRRGAE